VDNLLAISEDIRYILHFRPRLQGPLCFTLRGDLVYLKVFGQSILVINSTDVAYELFEKRSSIYSDRTELPMLKDLYVGWAKDLRMLTVI
jgi:hypothetical protein